MKNPNLVSILLPIHNAEEYLESCLISLQKQSHADIEIIAIDDLSRDNSYHILNTFKKHDKRIRISKNKKHYGPVVTLNRALRLARGAYIAFMDAHDLCTRQRIEKQLAYLQNHPKTVVVGTQCALVDRNNKKLGKSSFPYEHDTIKENLLLALSLRPETVMINRLLLPKDVLKFSHSLYPFLYTDVLMRLHAYGNFANLLEYLYTHRTKNIYSKLSKVDHVLAAGKLWIKSLAFHDYRPPVRSLITPFVR